jgi:hypothetical protein
MIPLGDGSHFLCGSSSGSLVRTISCSFPLPAQCKALRPNSDTLWGVAHCLPIAMQNPVKECIGKFREEITQLAEADRLYSQGGKKLHGAPGDHERRLQRLQEIIDELVPLTDWEKTMKKVSPRRRD